MAVTWIVYENPKGTIAGKYTHDGVVFSPEYTIAVGTQPRMVYEDNGNIKLTYNRNGAYFYVLIDGTIALPTVPSDDTFREFLSSDDGIAKKGSKITAPFFHSEPEVADKVFVLIDLTGINVESFIINRNLPTGFKSTYVKPGTIFLEELDINYDTEGVYYTVQYVYESGIISKPSFRYYVKPDIQKNFWEQYDVYSMEHIPSSKISKSDVFLSEDLASTVSADSDSAKYLKTHFLPVWNFWGENIEPTSPVLDVARVK